jgi:CheY-like chemotaxis protein
MQKLLVVDDDTAMRNLLRIRLSDAFDVIDTGQSDQAIGLALEHKPVAILLDLMMDKCSGFELCQSLRSLSYTSLTPIFVITGEVGENYKEHCANLGATAYFEKPVDFQQLRDRLDSELQAARPERRAHVRVRMRIIVKLRGVDANGDNFVELCATENVSAGGFLCPCTASLCRGACVEVFLAGAADRFVGKAQVVRQEAPGAPWQRYGFQFRDKTTEWVLQAG